MASKIGREIADAQYPIGGEIVVPTGEYVGLFLVHERSPMLMQGENLVLGEGGVSIAEKQCGGANESLRRGNRPGLFEVFPGQFDPSLGGEQSAIADKCG